jgi:hypothetical protein
VLWCAAAVVVAAALAGSTPGAALAQARHYGDAGGAPLAAPIVAMASTPNGRGYWLVAADGGVLSYGNARFHGSTGGMALARPIVGMAPTFDGRGYWLVAGDGGVFSFGNARFHGSTGASPPASGVVGIAPTNTGAGYWIASARGEVFAFGDARFHGDLRGLPINAPIIDIVTAPFGSGYYLLSADGGVFSFGSATFHGSTGGMALARPVTAMVPFPFGYGYWLVASDGGVFTFGRGSSFFGSWAAAPPSAPVVAGAAAADGRGYWLATSAGQVRAFSGSRMAPRGSYGLTPRRLPSPAAPLRVLGLGDSMMISMQRGLGSELAATREALLLGRGKWGYGFTSSWQPLPPCFICDAAEVYAPRSLSEHVRVDNFDAAVLMVGGWDPVAREVDGRRLEPWTREWRRWYRSVQDDAMRRLTREGAVVFWVSYPACGQGGDAARLHRFSKRTTERHDDVVWLDLHAHLCPDGTPKRPWFDGRRIDVLSDNGHFTDDGARWVGRWITREMRSTFALATIR